MALREIKRAKVARGFGKRLLEGARFCVEDDSEIVGYAIVAMHKNGRTSSSAAVGDRCPLNRFAFLGYVTEVLREDLISSEGARRIVNRANGFEE